MRRLTGVNRKAGQIEEHLENLRRGQATPSEGGPEAEAGAEAPRDVIGLRSGPPGDPQIPLGCTLIFSPGWETDSSGSTAGLCQPVERDLFDCHLGCFWPAQVPDQLNHAPDWTSRCAAAEKDWRNIDLIFP